MTEEEKIKAAEERVRWQHDVAWAQRVLERFRSPGRGVLAVQLIGELKRWVCRQWQSGDGSYHRGRLDDFGHFRAVVQRERSSGLSYWMWYVFLDGDRKVEGEATSLGAGREEADKILVREGYILPDGAFVPEEGHQGG